MRRRVLWIVVASLLVGAALGGGWYLTRDRARPPASAPAGSPPASGQPATRDAAGRRTLTVLGAGDVLPHPEMWQQALQDGHGTMDFLPMLAGAVPAVEAADLAICHLEPTVAPQGGPYEGFPKFSVPVEIIDTVKRVGFDACSTSSNHALDHGEEGVLRNLAALDKAGIGHTGTFATSEKALAPTIYKVRGVNIGHLSYSKHFNGLPLPDGKAWMANQIDVATILAAAKRTRQAGADIVLLSVHWGTEYEHEPDPDQQMWAKKLIASPDIDAILGHHAHVVQPAEKINGKWVVYGMGNQIARHAEPVNANREGVMMRFTFVEIAPRKWQVSRLEAIPIWVDLNPDIRLVDLAHVLADPATPPGKKAIYQAALDRIRGNLSSRGAIPAGLIVAGTG